MTPSTDLRTTIAARRRALGMTQARLAALAGLHQHRLSEYERGKRDLTGRTLDAVLAALGLSVIPSDDSSGGNPPTDAEGHDLG